MVSLPPRLKDDTPTRQKRSDMDGTRHERILNGTFINPKTRCWEWNGHKDKKGYGRMSDAQSCEVLVHRISWCEFIGQIPKGMHILYHCDNPKCCNPEHLYVGTNEDNVKDRQARGRSKGAAGEKNTKAKLTENDVLIIRKSTGTHASLGRKYGVSYSTISAIRSGKTWSYLL